jgi:hypothetical protein
VVAGQESLTGPLKSANADNRGHMLDRAPPGECRCDEHSVLKITVGSQARHIGAMSG